MRTSDAARSNVTTPSGSIDPEAIIAALDGSQPVPEPKLSLVLVTGAASIVALEWWSCLSASHS